jgi:hypothetical protein
VLLYQTAVILHGGARRMLAPRTTAGEPPPQQASRPAPRAQGGVPRNRGAGGGHNTNAPPWVGHARRKDVQARPVGCSHIHHVANTCSAAFRSRSVNEMSNLARTHSK